MTANTLRFLVMTVAIILATAPVTTIFAQEPAIHNDKLYADGEAIAIKYTDTLTIGLVKKPPQGKLHGFDISIINGSQERIDFYPERDVTVDCWKLGYSSGKRIDKSFSPLDQYAASSKYAKKAGRGGKWSSALLMFSAGLSRAAEEDTQAAVSQMRAYEVSDQTDRTMHNTFDTKAYQHIGRTTILPNNQSEGWFTIKVSDTYTCESVDIAINNTTFSFSDTDLE